MFVEPMEEFTRRVGYDIDGDTCYFVPRCPKCGRFVKADETIMVNGLGEISPEPNGTCKIHGKVNMPCEGFI